MTIEPNVTKDILKILKFYEDKKNSNSIKIYPNMDFSKYYDLNQYLFNEVSKKYQDQGYINALHSVDICFFR